MSNTTRKPTTTFLDEETRAAVKRLAERDRRSLANQIEVMLKQQIAAEEAKAA